MSRAYDLHKRYTERELADMGTDIRNNPDNLKPQEQRQGFASIYTKSATRKLDDIGMAIYLHQKERNE